MPNKVIRKSRRNSRRLSRKRNSRRLSRKRLSRRRNSRRTKSRRVSKNKRNSRRNIRRRLSRRGGNTIKYDNSHKNRRECQLLFIKCNISGTDNDSKKELAEKLNLNENSKLTNDQCYYWKAKYNGDDGILVCINSAGKMKNVATKKENNVDLEQLEIEFTDSESHSLKKVSDVTNQNDAKTEVATYFMDKESFWVLNQDEKLPNINMVLQNFNGTKGNANDVNQVDGFMKEIKGKQALTAIQKKFKAKKLEVAKTAAAAKKTAAEKILLDNKPQEASLGDKYTNLETAINNLDQELMKKDEDVLYVNIERLIQEVDDAMADLAQKLNDIQNAEAEKKAKKDIAEAAQKELKAKIDLAKQTISATQNSDKYKNPANKNEIDNAVSDLETIYNAADTIANQAIPDDMSAIETLITKIDDEDTTLQKEIDNFSSLIDSLPAASGNAGNDFQTELNNKLAENPDMTNADEVKEFLNSLINLIKDKNSGLQLDQMNSDKIHKKIEPIGEILEEVPGYGNTNETQIEQLKKNLENYLMTKTQDTSPSGKEDE